MSWRDVYKVHQAADVFPMLTEEELRKLGKDIKKNGLHEPIVMWSNGDFSEGVASGEWFLLDGRNRVAAMELVGIDVLPRTPRGLDDLFSARRDPDYPGGLTPLRLIGSPDLPSIRGKKPPNIDPYAYAISKNIRRRHLTKEQQADLIVAVMKTKAGSAKMANPVKPRNEKGQLQGQQTKDPVKQAAVEEGAKHGISKRTIERAMAKDRGPTRKETVTWEGPGGHSAELPKKVPRKTVPSMEKPLAKEAKSGQWLPCSKCAPKFAALLDRYQKEGKRYDDLQKQIQENLEQLTKMWKM